MFKVGDMVRLKSGLIVYEAYDGIVLYSSMARRVIGRIVRVKLIDANPPYCNVVYVCGSEFVYSEGMFEKVGGR